MTLFPACVPRRISVSRTFMCSLFTTKRVPLQRPSLNLQKVNIMNVRNIFSQYFLWKVHNPSQLNSFSSQFLSKNTTSCSEKTEGWKAWADSSLSSLSKEKNSEKYLYFSQLSCLFRGWWSIQLHSHEDALYTSRWSISIRHSIPEISEHSQMQTDTQRRRIVIQYR